jgi:hypothetical protein
MPTETEKNENGTTAKNGNSNFSFLARQPTHANHSPFGAGRGRTVTGPNPGSAMSNAQNRTNGR